ncbi:MAG: phosphate ABC transporter substrate-binding protein [Leptospirales bacterium]
MFNRKKSFITGFITGVSLLTILTLSACGGKSQTLNVSGSDTMVQLVQNLAKKFMEVNPTKMVSVSGGGSGTGIATLLNGQTDIATASRTMKDKEWKLAEGKGIKITEHIVAIDMLAVVVHPDNPVKQLTLKQLRDIFTGKITNWKEVGGNDSPILALSRENNSGTHVYFKEEVVRLGKKDSDAEYGTSITFANSSQQIIDQVKGNISAISYVGMGWLTDEVTSLKMENPDNGKYFLPSIANSGKDKYPLGRTLQMYTNDAFLEKATPFIEFIKSEAGQAVVRELGFISL